MTFTYLPGATPDDNTLIRFHVGDTVEGEHYLSDEEIALLLAEAGSVSAGVLSAITFIIARLSQPNFKADWLTVDNATARKGFEGLLALKRREFGVAAVAGGVQSVSRSDRNRYADCGDPSGFTPCSTTLDWSQ